MKMIRFIMQAAICIVIITPFTSRANDTAKPVENIPQQSDFAMTTVPGGCFQMGEFMLGNAPDERPVHKVCLSGFLIGTYEVTQDQWKQVMGNRPAHFRECGGNCPVEQVSWDEVQQFIQRLNKKTGLQFRLPTEAEWEYACRSGGKQQRFCGGDDIDAVAWHQGNSGGKPHPVGQKQANGLGIYDMSGNVWEWVQDWFDQGYYRTSPCKDPQGPIKGSEHILRGGCWDCEPKCIRASLRYWFAPNGRFNGLGFRLARSIPNPDTNSGGNSK